MTNKHCIHAFSEDGHSYRMAIKGLRGKRREAFKLAVVRAATLGEKVFANAAKDKRIPKLVKLSHLYATKLKKLQREYNEKGATIAASFNTKMGEIAKHIPSFHIQKLNTMYLESLFADEEIRKLVGQIETLGHTLRSEQHAARKSEGCVSECGVALPHPTTAKKVLSDPKLKALIDGIGKEESA